ncbi:hypothetical protein GF420_05405 [candidate division GN15 bacterium]|nr:hypothetical protein [candidate division GN15 bacterium]
MFDREVIEQARAVADQAAVKAGEYNGTLGEIKHWIVEHFGENGLLAAYIAGGVVLIVLLSRVAKLGFSALKYLVVPSVVLAGLASYFMGLSFAVALPVTVTICSLVLLFKG